MNPVLAGDEPDAGALEDEADEGYGEPLNTNARKRARRNKDVTPDDEAADAGTPCNLHPRDPTNFLKLCQAVRILINRQIKEEDLKAADILLRSYCQELVEVSLVILQ